MKFVGAMFVALMVATSSYAVSPTKIIGPVAAAPSGGGCANAEIQCVEIGGEIPTDDSNGSEFETFPEGTSGEGATPGSGFAGDNDGTTGKAMDFNRQPGCLNEQIFMDQTTSNVIAQGSPIGTYVPLKLGDPLYSNGEWEKWQTEVIMDSWSIASNRTTTRRIMVHYMYNATTNTVAQMKLKNSYEYGCVGFLKN